MSEPTHPGSLKRVKTGAFERRFSLAKASVVASTRFAASAAGSLFAPAEEREERRRRALAHQADYLVTELGKLKGSIVKIGQMMALYGEHFLPEEITEALHRLNDDTAALEWSAMEQVLRTELGARLDDLEVDPQPLGAASLGQVHRARRRADGQELVLKIQYPGVAQAVDSDLNLVTNLLRVTRAVPQTREFDEWLEEVRMMMHREVNYPLELETTRLFHEYLKDDSRYIVPRVFPEFSTDHVLCMSYEDGVPIRSDDVLGLPQERKNRLAEAALDLCCREVFAWGEVQTDPNFGNYLVRLGNGADVADRIVLLDFGAVRDFPEKIITLARNMTKAAFTKNRPAMLEAMGDFNFFANLGTGTRDDLVDLCFLAFEPFAAEADVPVELLTMDGRYRWAKSNLHTRATLKAAKSAATTSFSAPPKEFMFLSRKLMGVYTFMTVIEAEVNGRRILERYVQV